VQNDSLEGDLSDFRGAPGVLVPSAGHVRGTLRSGGREIEGTWESDAGHRGHFLATKDEPLALSAPTPTPNQPSTWEAEVKHHQIPPFLIKADDLRELARLFDKAAKEARERHERWLAEYWRGQPPPAATAAIPLPTIETTQGEMFTSTTDAMSFDVTRIRSDLNAIGLYSYKQGASVTHGVQVLIIGINGQGDALPSAVINVHGLDLHWTRGVLQTFQEFFQPRRVWRGWLHKPIAQQTVPFVSGLVLLAMLFSLVLALPARLVGSPVLAFGAALYAFLCLNFIGNAFLKLWRRAYPLYEVEFARPTASQKLRRVVWAILGVFGLLVLGVVSNEVTGWLNSLLTHLTASQK
jgi:hypothetical protein